MSYQIVIVQGNLGSDPETRFTQDQKAVCNFSVATSNKWKDKQGQVKEDTEWHKIVVWGKTAEHCQQYLAKGKSVLVQGKLRTNKWQDKQGADRYSTDLVADSVQFLSPKSEGHHPQPNAQPAVDVSDVPF